VALLLAATAGCVTTGTIEQRGAAAAGTASRQLLVTVYQPATAAAGLTGAPNQWQWQRRYGATPSVERTLAQIAREHGLDRVDGWAIQSLEVYCEVFAVPANRDVDEVVAALRRDTRVDLAQRMNLFSTQTVRYDDPYLDLQSAAVQLDVEGAHEFATGRGVSVAIIDSAVDANHPDLRGRVRVARDLVGDRAHSRGEVHGTAVAGIIASTANNHEGIIGVAPDASLAALRACWSVTAKGPGAQCSTFSLALALEVAIDLAPQVVNLSLAGPPDALLSRLLDRVLARGIVVVAAYPPSGDTALTFPSSHPGVLTAHSSLTPVSSSSSFVLAAPGDEVLTTAPGAGYAFLNGNSLAAAHTTGVVALLKERKPDLDAERIAAILSTTTTYGPGTASINACRAVASVAGAAPCETPASAAR
jgi:subtilisin family serine protease